MLTALHLLGHLVDQLEDWSEVRRPRQLHVVNGSLVDFGHAFDTVDFWVKDVAIEGETVPDLVVNDSSVAKDRDLLIAVVILQDVPHRVDRLKVLVLSHVERVQGAGLLGVTIRCSEVNRDL